MKTKMLSTTTPNKISPAIAAFCQKIQPSAVPEYVPVVPQANEQFDDCVNIVRRKVKQDGGQEQLGWNIWEFPYTLLDAEFHSVWISPEGKKVDVSPKQDGEKQILFLPDPTLICNGQRIDNHTEPLRQHELIDELIRLFAQKRKLWPDPGKAVIITANSPLRRILERINVIVPHVQRMAQARKASHKRR